MKKSTLFVLLLIVCSQAMSQSWTFPTPRPRCSTMVSPNCTIIAVNDGDWESPATWSPARIPIHNDIVCIPAGRTVEINNKVYREPTSCIPLTIDPVQTPSLYLFICGTLAFKAGGKMHLGNMGFIQVYAPTGIITAANGNSDLINMGCVTVWDGNNDVTGPFVITPTGGGPGVLPVSFDFLKAEQKQPFTVQLEWATNYEENNTDYTIQRSADQRNWSTIGTVQSIGNSAAKTVYRFNDKSPLSGTNFYRIKQVDLDGKTGYSEVARLNNQVKKTISVYPNPAGSVAQVYSKTTFTQGQVLQLIDAKGSRVKTFVAAGKNALQLDLSNLQPGLYLLQLIENGRVVENTSLIKQ